MALARTRSAYSTKVFDVPVQFKDGTKGTGRANGNNAAWLCACGDPLPLLGRTVVFGKPSEASCPSCKRRYQVQKPKKKPIKAVIEL
jgi:hypothetical protein